MFTFTTLLIVALVCLAVGVAAGLVVGRTWVPPAQQKALEQSLSATKDELNNYQQDVARHFMETSRHIGELTQSYRDLHEHLAKGAMKLTSIEIGRQLIDAGTKADVVVDMEDMNIEPPKDWAPKLPGAQGMLSEEFGLKEQDENTPQAPVVRYHG